MKKTFTLLTALLLSVAIYAYPKQSSITISTTGNYGISVTIDGKQYKVKNNYVSIDDLSAGYHSIKIYRQTNGRKNGRFNSSLQQIYNSNLYIKPQYDVDIIVSRFGKVFIDEQSTNDRNWNDRNNDCWKDDDDDWNDRDNDWNDRNSSNNSQTMSSSQFEQFKQTIKKEVFSDTKVAIAKQGISSNYFSAGQVKEILQLFTFEDNKLDVAKYAYKYTIDQNNYYTILDVFTFSSSKTELMDYIQKNK
ncbi:DUF4476 domain-containing protein [Ferruginibacter sp. SUN002]|uniref:DUF4476 domain-containing protein n=1 Tax=Ferruginibacter sp. SUN002 TaxID=2937789 RepID=UPI003D365682